MSKSFLNSLYVLNGLKLISLLLFLVASINFVACSSTREATSKDYLYSDSSKETKIVKRTKIINDARAYLGTPYLYAGKTPKGFDCSGFTYFIMKENGVQLNSSSQTQSNQGKQKGIQELEPGDLIFFGKTNNITHVGIITRNDKSGVHMIHSSSSRGIIEENVSKSSYWKPKVAFGRSVLN